MDKAIVIIGGYNSVWPVYLKMARDLEDLSGLPAIGVPLMPWDWWAARIAGDGTNILLKLQETVRWARRRFGAREFILAGHSAGGLVARLYLCDEPVWGHVYAGVDHVTTLVTLGSPHCCSRRTDGSDDDWFLVDAANRQVPAAPYAGRVRYLAVAGQSVHGSQNGDYAERRAFRFYRMMGGQGATWGDGMVPVNCAVLEGAETMILEGVGHSGKVSRNWYGGSAEIVRRWWPPGVQRGS